MLDREARMADMSWPRSRTARLFSPPQPDGDRRRARLLRATNDVLIVLSKLPVDLSPSPALLKMKCVGLILIFNYPFFKFAWAYRLFNVAILYGATPPASKRDTPEAEEHVFRITRLFEASGRHFNRGPTRVLLRTRLFASHWVLFVSTGAVVIVTWRRQFASHAWRALESQPSARM